MFSTNDIVINSKAIPPTDGGVEKMTSMSLTKQATWFAKTRGGGFSYRRLAFCLRGGPFGLPPFSHDLGAPGDRTFK